MWILGNARRELSSFYGLALTIIVFSGLWSNQPMPMAIILLVTVGIDTSHVYATAWRSWFVPSEVKRAKWLHIFTPLAIMIVIFLWCSLGIPGLWSAVLYLTVFHHIRQYYGIHRWSLAINPNKGPMATKELYAMSVLPFIGYHFRSDINYQGFFTPDDMFLFPNPEVLNLIYLLMAVAFISLIYKISIAVKDKTISIPILSTVIFPVFINIFCFLISKDFFITLLPVLAVHGMTYYHLSALAQGKLKKGFWSKPRVAVAIIVSTSILFGFLESFLTEEQIDIIPSIQYQGNYLLAFGVAFVTTPAIYHYIADAFLWKRTHPDFKKIVY
tara:strand:- start:281 stop:1267 length:987 start_codon:yes stop_codon:yes gene_type:complete